MAHYDSNQTVVFDNGTGAIKVGFAGNDTPECLFPTIVGFRRNLHKRRSSYSNGHAYVGDEVKSMGGILDIKYPMEHGVVTNWDDMEKIWNHGFWKELRVDPSKQPVLLTESAFSPSENKERMAQIMFECFEVPAMYVEIDTVLFLYATGVTTGLVINCGDGATSAMPIFEGYQMPDAHLNFGGRDVTDYLMKILAEEDVSKREIARDVKEKVAYVALNYEQEMEEAAMDKSVVETAYELPDGQVITIGAQRMRCTEILFQPTIVDLDCAGIHEMANDCVMACHEDTRRKLYGNIFLSGAMTRLPGFVQRLKKEISAVAPGEMRVNLHDLMWARYGSWMGGSILASSSSFQKMLISKGEYDESGPSVVHRKRT